MEFKGTKKEWIADDVYSEKVNGVITHNCDVINEFGDYVFSAMGENKETVHANGKLGAAAPELLKACINAEKHHQGHHSEIGIELRKAIEKALK